MCSFLVCKQLLLCPKLHLAVPIQASQQLVLPVGSPPPQGFSFVFVSLLQNWTQGFCWRICHNLICLFYCHLALVFLQNYSLLSYIHLLAKFSVSLPLVLQVQPLCRVLLAESKINYILQIVIYLSVCLLFEHWSIILVKLLYVSLRPLSQLELFLLAVSVSTGCGMLC